jgi:starvation-inducible outer membrane lipoprotein
MHPISKGAMAKIDRDRTFPAVMEDPVASVGSTVLWGGVIGRVFHEQGEIKLIVSQAPLNSKAYPQTEASDGEFAAHTSRPLDPQTFHKGMKVTIAGEIDGVEEKEFVSDPGPRPVVRIIEIYAWKERNWGNFTLFRGWIFTLFGPPQEIGR